MHKQTLVNVGICQRKNRQNNQRRNKKQHRGIIASCVKFFVKGLKICANLQDTLKNFARIHTKFSRKGLMTINSQNDFQSVVDRLVASEF